MHGKLVSPWTTKEDDRRILDLTDLVHRLTRGLILKGVRVREDPLRKSNKAAPAPQRVRQPHEYVVTSVE